MWHCAEDETARRSKVERNKWRGKEKEKIVEKAAKKSVKSGKEKERHYIGEWTSERNPPCSFIHSSGSCAFFSFFSSFLFYLHSNLRATSLSIKRREESRKNGLINRPVLPSVHKVYVPSGPSNQQGAGNIWQSWAPTPQLLTILLSLVTLSINKQIQFLNFHFFFTIVFFFSISVLGNFPLH